MIKYIFCSIWIFSSCFRDKTVINIDPEVVFEAGDNQNELRHVIRHFAKHPKDSLKLKAAVFLINNMSNQNTYVRNRSIDSFTNYMHEFWTKKFVDSTKIQDLFNKLIDSFNFRKTLLSAIYKPDCATITSNFLIENIDDAFWAWRNYPWAREVAFLEFCRHTLPYKVYMEPVSAGWRKKVMKDFSWILDSLHNPCSIKEVTILVNNYLRKCLVYSPSLKPIPQILSYDDIAKIKAGKCEHLITFTTYVLRGLGIPAMVDYAPVWGNNSSGHIWGALKDENNKLFTYDALYTDSKVELLAETNVIPEGVLRKRRAPKINRYSYESQPIKLLSSNVHVIDVTNEYNFPTKNVLLEFNSISTQDQVYLSVYNTNKWKLCALGARRDACKILFTNMGTDIIYLPIILNSDSTRMEGSPFLLDTAGEIHFFTPNLKAKQTLRVNRKANEDYDLTLALSATVGGIIQGSSDRSFTKAKNLFTVSTIPEPRTNVYTITEPDYFQYFRYVQPNGSCRVAQLKFSGKIQNDSHSHPLHGDLIFDNWLDGNLPNHILDSNVLSYYVSKSVRNGYIGIDLGERFKARLTKVEFYPPNDGNSIEVGDEYELCFWLNTWVSLGRKKSTEESLVYINCPTNAVFRLKNLSKGYKERIFTYDRDKQIWW